MNLKFGKDEIRDMMFIAVSAISVILSFVLNINYLSWIAIILCGIPIFKECIEGLITEFDIKADLLVTLAIIASIIIGEIFAAGEIATIMAIGGFLEEYTVKRTRSKIKKLVKLTPQIARRLNDGKEEEINVDEVKIGDILKVLPGENIPTDGTIIKGETSINQSTLTGESLPVDKKENDEVFSGTTNLYGSFTMKTTKVSKDSSIQKLINLVESSSPENAKIVKTADKWATMIVVIAFTAAILTYLFTFEISRSVTILVVFCPCALVLATPTAITSAIGNLTKHGILVKNGASIEELAHVNELIFDKTGTLTHGTPEVIEVLYEDKNMMKTLASIESHSEHPLAKAIVRHYNSNDLYEVENFKIHIGKGVTGTVDGSYVIAGNKKLMKMENIPIKYENKKNPGSMEIYVAKDNKFLGKVFLADTLRNNTQRTINKLKKMNIKTTLLSGDSEETVKIIAEKVNADNYKSNCLPEDKTEYISQSQLKENRIVMIGDGINDAPSLKKANVGIVMGSIGSDVSIEAADIALINDDIGEIPHLVAISRKTLKVINMNIAFSLSLNFIAMIMAILGVLNPIAGALVHNIGSVIVIIYSSTLINFKLSRNEQKKSEKLGMTKHLNKSTT